MPELIVKLGDNIVQKYFFVRETMRVGRAPDNEIIIENLAVSRNHSVIASEDGRYIISDLGSSNGTFVNGVRVNKTEIMDKDVVTIGKHKLYFYDQRGAEAPARAVPVMDADRTMMVSASIAEIPPSAELIVTKGRQKGQLFTLTGNKTSIGRGADNDVRLNDWFISKHHAEIERRGSEYHIVDLGSWRHTMINGAVVNASRLEDGDEIQLGNTVVLSFKTARAAVRDNAGVVRKPVELGTPAPQTPESDEPEHVEAEAEGAVAVGGMMPTSLLSMDEVFSGSRGGSAAPPRPPAPHSESRPDEEYESAAAEVEEAWSSLMSGNGPSEAPAEPINGAAHANDEGGEWLAGEAAMAAEADEPAGEAEPLESPGHEEQPAAAAAQQDAKSAQADAASAGSYLLDHNADDAVEALVENLARASVRGAVESATEAHASIEAHAAAEPETPVRIEPISSGRGAREADRDSGLERSSTIGSAQAAAPSGEVKTDEVLMWERALTNKSLLIRKQAARRLKQITGRDYEF